MAPSVPTEELEVLRRLAGEAFTNEKKARAGAANLLHDKVAQLLVAARMKLALARLRASPELVGELDAVTECIDETLDVVRSLTATLAPPQLRGLGLVAALRWLGKGLEQRFGISVEILAAPELHKVGPLGDVTGPAILDLLESVVASLHAAGARHLGIDADVEDGRVVIGIEAASAAPAGIIRVDLSDAYERVRWFGCELEAEGTRISLKIPRA